MVLLFPADIAESPAVTDTYFNGVFLTQIFGNVVGLILNAIFIARPTGSKDTFADSLTVYKKGVITNGGYLDARLFYFFLR